MKINKRKLTGISPGFYSGSAHRKYKPEIQKQSRNSCPFRSRFPFVEALAPVGFIGDTIEYHLSLTTPSHSCPLCYLNLCGFPHPVPKDWSPQCFSPSVYLYHFVSWQVQWIRKPAWITCEIGASCFRARSPVWNPISQAYVLHSLRWF